MNTSLAIPALARYWMKFRQDDDHEYFLQAAQALTGFIVLRRAATGSIAGIDSELRALMSGPSVEGSRPLCVGLLTQPNTPPTLEEFKSVLQHYLKGRTIRVDDEASWVKRVSENPLAQQSRPLTRFLLLAAAEQSQPDKAKPGLWSREDVTKTDERSYLNYKSWIEEKYSTVEHVAPESKPEGGWDESIYRRTYTRHTLGNLILLPQKENSSVGNAGWEKKKIFYLALMEREKSEQERCIQSAREEGFPFSKKVENLLESGERLHFLDPLYDMDAWDENIIYTRTDNIVRLAWQKISPWLFSQG